MINKKVPDINGDLAAVSDISIYLDKMSLAMRDIFKP